MCSGNPIIAEIDGKKNVLTLEQQKRALQQLETDMVARKEQADSQLAGASGTAQPQSDRRAAGTAAHRVVQEPGADYGADGGKAESRGELQFRDVDAGHPRGRHVAAGYAGGRYPRL